MSHCLGSFYTHVQKMHFYSIILRLKKLKFILKFSRSLISLRLLFSGQDYLITIIIILFHLNNQKNKKMSKIPCMALSFSIYITPPSIFLPKTPT
jgi:hypothetical protein